MAKNSKKKNPFSKCDVHVVNPNAAGIDISPREMQVCVPADRCEDNNRTFDVYTKDLHSIAEWLLECRITTVVMESTGVYWLPIFKVLQDHGLEVVLVNAHDVKNISGKKTDYADAEWLMTLHTYGFLKPCYQPDNDTRSLRNLIRHRENLLRMSSIEVNHLHKAMEQMNLKLNNVFSNILGLSAQSIIEAILEGERDAEELASMADPKCKSSHEEIVKSLEATWDEDLLFIMRQSHEAYKFYQSQIAKCDEKINELSKKLTAKVDDSCKNLVRSEKHAALVNKVNFDIEEVAYKMFGVNVMHIPGISHVALLKLIGELGPGFTSKFQDIKHFLSWANLVPNNKISGGALLSSRVPRKKNPVGIIFRQSANALKSSKTPLGNYFRHIRAKSGYKQAIVATAKKLATIFYTMVLNQTEYDPSNYAADNRNRLEKQIAYANTKLIRLERELAACL